MFLKTNINNINAKKELVAELEKQRQKQKELENKPVEKPTNPFKKYKSITTKDTIIKIDRFHFKVSQNIESITTELSVGIKKIETMRQHIYQKIGGNEETISFNARILIQDILDFQGFKELIKQARPLKLTILGEKSKRILIQRLSESKKDWILTSQRDITFYTKELSIEGVIL